MIGKWIEKRSSVVFKVFLVRGQCEVIRLFDLPFPFCQELFDDESGLGFCLRVVTTNGGKLHLLRKMLGIGRSVRFNAVHAQKLADRKSTRLNSSHLVISYAVFCLKKKKKKAILSDAHNIRDTTTVNH